MEFILQQGIIKQIVDDYSEYDTPIFSMLRNISTMRDIYFEVTRSFLDNKIGNSCFVVLSHSPLLLEFLEDESSTRLITEKSSTFYYNDDGEMIAT